LVGWYTEARDCAIVTQIGAPPSDSRHGRATFTRGTRGLKRMLEEAGQRNGSRYIGEWHFHPGASPAFSHVDAEQMTHIANSRSANCPEPLLLLLGGSTTSGWEPSVHVFPRGQPPVGLRLQSRVQVAGMATSVGVRALLSNREVNMSSDSEERKSPDGAAG